MSLGFNELKVCYLYDTKPLPEPKLTYCKLAPLQYVKFHEISNQIKKNIFFQENAFENVWKILSKRHPSSQTIWKMENSPVVT